MWIPFGSGLIGLLAAAGPSPALAGPAESRGEPPVESPLEPPVEQPVESRGEQPLEPRAERPAAPRVEPPLEPRAERSAEPRMERPVAPQDRRPTTLRARRWIGTGGALLGLGAALGVGAWLVAASDRCDPLAGNSCSADARGRAAWMMGGPALALLVGGSTALGVGIHQRRYVTPSVSVGRHGALGGVRFVF